MNENGLFTFSAVKFASFFFPPILLVALGLLFSTCYQHDDPFDDWILHYESRNMYGVVIDSSSGGKLDSVFIGEKKDWYTVVGIYPCTPNPNSCSRTRKVSSYGDMIPCAIP